MALDQYHHGVRVAEVNDGTRTIRTVSTAVIAVVYNAPDADETTNQPALVTNVDTAIGEAGLKDTLTANIIGTTTDLSGDHYRFKCPGRSDPRVVQLIG